MLLSEAQMRRIEAYFPLWHGVPRVDDRLILSGIIFVLRNVLRWRDAPREYGLHKTIYNRFIRWSRLGALNVGLLYDGRQSLLGHAAWFQEAREIATCSKLGNGLLPVYRTQG